MTTDMNFAGELTIATQVADLDRSLAWYAEMLGCEVIYKLDDMGWAEITSPVPNVAIGLSQVEKPKTAGAVPVWSVADIDKARAALESRDVRFDGDTITIPEMVRLATFFDPDGNAWMLSQSLMEPECNG